MHRKGRRSGGIAVYIRNSYIEHFEELNSDFEFGVFLKIKNTLVSHDLVLCAVYVPPERSSAYSDTDDSGIVLLDVALNDITARSNCNRLIVTGDLNARTALLEDFIPNDDGRYSTNDNFYECDQFCMPRNNSDCANDNRFGRELVDLCAKFKIHIVNGRKEHDRLGMYTCFTNNGASTVDYTLVSTEIFEDVTDFEIFENDTLTHLPQQFTFLCNRTDNIENAKNENTDIGCERGIYKWCEDSLVNLSNEQNRELINVFNSYIDTGQPSQAQTHLLKPFKCL